MQMISELLNNETAVAFTKLGAAALLPVFAAAILYLLDKKTPFGRMNGKVKQVIFGIIFGGIAVLGTEWGIPYEGAVMNCRDAAVLTGGLMFGAPTGIIAGIIASLERWFSVYWGVGSFTRAACTVSTLLAGFYAAALRKYMFEDKKPGWLISFAIGVVMEVFHMIMVFLTNMATAEKAMTVVKTCAPPMIVANGISVMLASFVITCMARERISLRHDNVNISQIIQRRLLVTVVLAFLATSLFVFSLQDKIAETQTDTLLDLAVHDIASDITDESDKHLIETAHSAADDIGRGKLTDIAEKYGLAEISVVNSEGVITDSTATEFVGFVMAGGEQSAKFLCLLGDTKEYAQEYGPIAYDPHIMRKYAGVKTETGFIQVGYNAAGFQKDIDDSVSTIARNRHVGRTGFILILDEELNLICAPKTMDDVVIDKEEISNNAPEENTTFVNTVNGENMYIRYIKTEGYYIISALPESEALQMRNIVLYVNVFMEIIVFAILFALIYMLIKAVVVNQLKKVNGSLAKITGGDLNEAVNVRTSEEFASLSDDINSTVTTLKNYIAEASARIDKELEFAKNIQTSALPGIFPAFPKRKDFDIYATMDPAKEVGGDFYDFYMTDRNMLYFLVADVSGKGIPAAMFMMRAKTELKTLTESDIPLNEVFTRGNAALCEGNDAGMFVTAWQGGIDLNTGVVRFANAGHNPPLVYRKGTGFEYLRSRAGFVLAGMEGVNYKTQELTLEPGDKLYLYTDGVTEAQNERSELYGEERLLTLLNSREFESCEDICKAVKDDIDAFVGTAPQFDDITMVAFDFKGKPPVPTLTFEKATLDDIPKATEFIEAELEKKDVPMKTVIQINVAIDEIFSNIVRYGYPKKPGPVTVKLFEEQEGELNICFIDEGIPYNPVIKEDPDVTLSAEERDIGGLGIFMVKKSMDDMKYRYEDGKNILTLVKKI